MRMKGYPESPGRPLVTGTQMLGLNLRVGRGDYGLGVGYDSSSRVVMPESGTLGLQWPTNYTPLPWEMRSLFTAEIGTNFPPVLAPDSEQSVSNPAP